LKVILTEDVKKLGKKDELVEASDGYARNFLLPRGMAFEATPSKLQEWKQKRKSEKVKEEKQRQDAEETRKHLQGKQIKIRVSCGSTGKLFGSVTNANIAEAIRSQMKVDIDKKDIKIDESVKNTGQYPITIKLYPGMDVNMIVKVEGE